jgi:hypothetical protein
MLSSKVNFPGRLSKGDMDVRKKEDRQLMIDSFIDFGEVVRNNSRLGR